MSHILRNDDQTVNIEEKKKAVESVFIQYDKNGTGELTPIQAQILHGDMRIGGISFPQVSLILNCLSGANPVLTKKYGH